MCLRFVVRIIYVSSDVSMTELVKHRQTNTRIDERDNRKSVKDKDRGRGKDRMIKTVWMKDTLTRKERKKPTITSITIKKKTANTYTDRKKGIEKQRSLRAFAWSGQKFWLILLLSEQQKKLSFTDIWQLIRRIVVVRKSLKFLNRVRNVTQFSCLKWFVFHSQLELLKHTRTQERNITSVRQFL